MGLWTAKESCLFSECVPVSRRVPLCWTVYNASLSSSQVALSQCSTLLPVLWWAAASARALKDAASLSDVSKGVKQQLTLT